MAGRGRPSLHLEMSPIVAEAQSRPLVGLRLSWIVVVVQSHRPLGLRKYWSVVVVQTHQLPGSARAWSAVMEESQLVLHHTDRAAGDIHPAAVVALVAAVAHHKRFGSGPIHSRCFLGNLDNLSQALH